MRERRESNEAVRSTVKMLRLALGDSQQAFGSRLGLSVITINRYEHDRLPNARNMARLERLARQRGFEDCASIFREALAEELKDPPATISRDDRAEFWQGLNRLCETVEKLAAATEQLRQLAEAREQSLDDVRRNGK